ncbi:MAG: hypothetical protein JXM68_10275, partial [Sedimentisphaerales bacterium]|nr:hypothetical protein [Sedimentisphaerales bacterium]
FDEAFFINNTASRTQALQELSNRYVEEIAANQAKLREKFAEEEPVDPAASSPGATDSGLDIAVPDLPEIKALD